jgi:bacteriocin-like protein
MSTDKIDRSKKEATISSTNDLTKTTKSSGLRTKCSSKPRSNHMTTQPKNKDKAEQKVSKDELTEKELQNITGGAGEVREVHHSEFTIVKLLDAATPKLNLT